MFVVVSLIVTRITTVYPMLAKCIWIPQKKKNHKFLRIVTSHNLSVDEFDFPEHINGSSKHCQDVIKMILLAKNKVVVSRGSAEAQRTVQSSLWRGPKDLPEKLLSLAKGQVYTP